LKLRKLTKMQAINDGTRTLIESIMMPELIAALREWANSGSGGVLIGGLGLSYHVRPRFTQDIDFLFLEPTDAPEAVPGFCRISSSIVEHLQTHVLVNIVSPSSVSIPEEIAEQIVLTATLSNRIRVATPSGLVALPSCTNTTNSPSNAPPRASTRYAVQIEGLSRREAARQFGIDPRTVAKMLAFSVPPGYRRSRPPARPKLDPFTGIIDGILTADERLEVMGEQKLGRVAHGEAPVRRSR
jgi:hypothetical protein